MEGEEASGSVLPRGFVEALFRAAASPALVLILGPGLPASWTVRTVDGDVVAESNTCDVGERVVEWLERQVPFVLEVSWLAEGTWLTSSWAVNVEDPSSLPPPDALRDLTLDELVAILSSTRPLPQAVTEIIKKRGKRRNADVEAGPAQARQHGSLLAPADETRCQGVDAADGTSRAPSHDPRGVRVAP